MNLHVWRDGKLIGRFDKDERFGATFEYTQEVTKPISLSLPLAGNWTKLAPIRFLF